jgi:hypothetical protein
MAMTMHEFSRFLEEPGRNDALFEALDRIRRSSPVELGLDPEQLPEELGGWGQTWNGLPEAGLDGQP